MKLLTSKELARAANLDIPGGVVIAKALMQIFRYNKLNRVYTNTYDSDPAIFINSILDHLDIRYDIPENDLENIPLTGPFITVSNHPFGGIDALILLKILARRRSDVRVMANFLLQKIDPLKHLIVPADAEGERYQGKVSLKGMEEAMNHVREGHGLALFPAGEVSAYHSESGLITDMEWQEQILREIKMAEVPVIPVYFHGTNSRWYHILGRIHPLLSTAKLGSELFNKRHKVIRVRIGRSLSVSEQAGFGDIARFGRYLRARTYSLGSSLEAKPFFAGLARRRNKRQEPVAPPSDRATLAAEISNIRRTHELFAIGNFVVLFAPTRAIPNLIREIGRMREVTFRAVGEGTNRATDLDEYDFYYHHLVIWDEAAGVLVGAYRVGKGREIISQYGIKGFYINSLFRIRKSFEPVLAESLELGRSFIVQEYQKKAMPLFLLWKGLLTVLLQNAGYRFLIGPVSISNEFSAFSKSLIVEFVRSNYFDREMARYIRPRKKFTPQIDRRIDSEIIISSAERDINKVEKVVSDVDKGYRIPVLLKKYLEVNARIIGFNVDPDFNNCLDGLIMLDIHNLPAGFVSSLSKDQNEAEVARRLRRRDS
ncbi:MAG TPA: GNAT family N-acyltransferase [Bacteroidales bacterium]|jgi:putative hemolysin|nr:lysophospholipid acyltransferase family protein [Bacteroidales bacterium]MDI9532627.1 GNAT family N-acyltransferase [Bacteroidota bacterium]OPZ57765.1 MAG: 2-acyl-glycerophospho-ethanolamine acyltransferase [Bacteroidetes bacterium ADurb.BinA012]MBK7732065.1 lysophospholipid acyltransferase family protein [Bacteroidales bacterium]MBP7036534.1 lysophospholipid acyltransferase family protein [Bacteroidales bacterium]